MGRYSKPKMFSDESFESRLSKAKKLSDLKNLGPKSEISFQKVGIKTAQQFVKLGWKKTMIKLISENSKNCHSIYAYALIGALTNTEWNRISASEKAEAQKFIKEIKMTLKKKKINAS